MINFILPPKKIPFTHSHDLLLPSANCGESWQMVVRSVVLSREQGEEVDKEVEVMRRRVESRRVAMQS